jgi:hypothetical protein
MNIDEIERAHKGDIINLKDCGCTLYNEKEILDRESALIAKVRELESEIRADNYTIEDLNHQIAGLKESLKDVDKAGVVSALRFYADENNWRWFQDRNRNPMESTNLVKEDKGVIARGAIKQHGGKVEIQPDIHAL